MDGDHCEFRYFRPQWSEIEEDGSIRMRVSVWDDEGHSSCIYTFNPNEDDYAFWLWLVEHPEFQRTLNDQALSAAKDRLDLESGLA